MNQSNSKKQITPYPLRLPLEVRREAETQAKLRYWSLNTYLLEAVKDRLTRDKTLEIRQ